jgi:signal transduction histidine kinase
LGYYRSNRIEIQSSLHGEADSDQQRKADTPVAWTTDIVKVCRNMVQEKELETPPSKNILFRLNPGNAKQPKTNIPQDTLARILSNIINNAIEALGNEGSIEIELTESARHLSIVIQDDGPGMSQDTLHKALNAHHSHGKKDGHGLGLKHAQEQLAKFGGSLAINSEVGNGTRVTIKVLTGA